MNAEDHLLKICYVKITHEIHYYLIVNAYNVSMHICYEKIFPKYILLRKDNRFNNSDL